MSREREKIERLADRMETSVSVARELYYIGGGDIDMIVEESMHSRGLNECKARILNKRISRLEK